MSFVANVAPSADDLAGISNVPMPMPPETRQSLLVRLHDADDETAWEEFCEIYEPLIYRIARSQGLQDADAKEIVQEVWISVAAAIAGFEHRGRVGQFRAWLMRVTRNHTINLLKKSCRSTAFGGHATGGSTAAFRLDQLAAADESPQVIFEKQFDREQRRQVFFWAAAKLKPKFGHANWQAFWRTSVEGEPIAAVAADLNLPVSTVHVARCRVMARLRDLVGRYTRPDPPTQQESS